MVEIGQILNPIVNIFDILMSGASRIVTFMFTPLSQLTPYVPDWLPSYISLPTLLFKLFPNQSFISIMLGGGIIVFIVVTMIKWVIGIIT